MSCLGNGNDKDNGEGKEDMQGGEKGTGKGKGTIDGKGKGKVTEDGKGKGRRKGKRNGKGKGIVKQTPGGDDIFRAIALQLQREMYEADLVTEGWLEWVYCRARSIARYVHFRRWWYPLYRVAAGWIWLRTWFWCECAHRWWCGHTGRRCLDGDVDMDRDGDDEEEEDEEEEDEEEEEEDEE